MNSLMIALLYFAPQPGLDCGHVLPPARHFVPLALTSRPPALNRPRLLANRYMRTAPAAAEPSADPFKALDADLLFYFDSHVQALSDNVAGSMNPWLQLHPLGAADDIFPGSGFSEPNAAGRPAGRQEHGRVPGSGNACS